MQFYTYSKKWQFQFQVEGDRRLFSICLDVNQVWKLAKNVLCEEWATLFCQKFRLANIFSNTL